MSEKPPSRDEALEALDFIVNVLKEHEKDLDKLIGELGTVAGQLGEPSELNDKVKKIEDKINGLQNEVSSLTKSLTASLQPATDTQPLSSAPTLPAKMNRPNLTMINGMPLFLRCKQWEDFQALAARAQTVSFELSEKDGTVEINALKNNQVIAYQGECPKLFLLIKLYLSKQLEVAENLILEGEIALK